MMFSMKRKTILNHRDFLTPKSGLSSRCDFFAVKTKLVKFSGDARYGLVVPKKTFKLAVHRNRAKRLLRDWIAFNEDLMVSELDYIFIAYEKILTLSRDDGRKNMGDVLKKIAKIYKSHENQE